MKIKWIFKYMLYNKIVLVTLMILSFNTWALPADVQATKDEGMRLYNIGHSTDAMHYLRQAAEAGDVEAMYYMGESERRQNMLGMTTEAMEWYLKAAEQGDPYSMLHLFRGGACIAGDRCPEDNEGWREAALDATLPKAEDGDPEAMLAMYHIYSSFHSSRLTWFYHVLGIPNRASKWLKSAAEAGLPEAQTLLGNQIMEGRGWYFTNNRRLAAAERWLRQAAEQDYVPAMNSLGGLMRKREAYPEAMGWYIAASEQGHLNGRMRLASCYIDPSEDPTCENIIQDRIKGWAIYYAINQELDSTASRRSLNLRHDLLTKNERLEGEELAEEWLSKKPPLSKFPPRLGY
ncbi:tetratricopeptide repeat protein [Vreelandella sulfidaeris]|uniref:tetratricopeptide repeat protein n=1 Tax=Vreelandella sulfidaeris TaxID=115553 RepID=UPI0035E6EEE0